MTVMLVSLQQASEHLRRDTDADDADLTLKIQAASRMVLDYLGDAADFLNSDGEVEFDSDGTTEDVPAEVHAAVLLLVGCLYEDREGGGLLSGGLPASVKSILYLYGRKPVFA